MKVFGFPVILILSGGKIPISISTSEWFVLFCFFTAVCLFTWCLTAKPRLTSSKAMATTRIALMIKITEYMISIQAYNVSLTGMK